MFKPPTELAIRLFFSTTLALVSVGYNLVNPPKDINQKIKPAVTDNIAATPPTSPLSVAATAFTNTNPTVANYYERAIDTASSAATISQSAQSIDDWNLVITAWKSAIELLKAVPVSSRYHAIAQTKIVSYQHQLSIAQQQAISYSTPSTSRVSGTSSQIAAANPQMFSAKIKRRIARTPVIEVTFNGNHTFEMIVDSGASSTVITPSMAKKMGLKANELMTADTASSTGVKFRSGKISSIAVNGAEVNNVQVAIANSNLDTGLLGQDFFTNYDVWIKRDVVEFYAR